MQKLLHAVNIGDRYEIHARLLPAMAAVLPVTILAFGAALHFGHFGGVIAPGSGLDLIVTILFSRVGHALGRRVEDQCRASWGGLPTTRWLMPDDTSHSEQQKRIWRQAIAKLSGLNIEAVLATGDIDELRRALDDGVLTARNKIRSEKRAELLRKQNIYYGFARNIAGLAPIAALLSLLSMGIAGVAACNNVAAAPLFGVEALFAVVSIAFVFLRKQYVCHCAERYAECFLTTAATIADVKKTAPRKKHPATKAAGT